jgi:hypothetical protein
MRAHGVSSFPDPKISSDGSIELGFGTKSHVDANAPSVKAAQRACQHLLPGSSS